MFEKLNGYQEGSFYTPNFITSYMCKESLQKIVLDRFNTAFGWSAKDLESLRKQIDRDFGRVESQAKRLLESIKICDPSVGSGHFLVSALNEMIAIYHKLGLLEFGYKDLQIKDDEIHLTTKEGEKFAYKRLQDSNHTIQIALFTLKKSIIENNLFGVDINPNSCNIARLRLWIELLKNAYYLNFSKDKDSKIHKLQTLPNIDINIKCGNSLISYFDMNSSLSHYPNIATKMQEYKQIVQNYKEGFYDNKAQIDRKIKDLLQAFRNFCFKDKFKKQTKDFETKCEEYSKKYGNFLAKEDKNLSLYVPQRMFIEDFDENEAKKEFQILQNSYNELFNLESNNPLEWRFAFPEVLDSNGDFLGFDLVIGNPPYIRQEEIKHLKPHLQKAFSIYKGTSDIYTYFYELGLKILKDNGILSFITSNKWCRAAYGEPLRKFLLENTTINAYLDLNGIKVFESATVDTSILEFHKAKANASHSLNYANPKDYNPKENEPLEESLELTQIPQDSLSIDSFIFTSPEIAALKAKIEKIGTPLKDWDINIYRGILTGYNEAFIIDTKKREEILNACANEEERARTKDLIKPILRGRDIKRYSYEWAGLWIINVHNGYTIDDSSLGGFCGSLDLPHCEAQKSVSHSSNPTQSTKSTQDTRIANASLKDSKTQTKEVQKIKIPPIDIDKYPTLKTYFDKVASEGKQSKGKGFYNRDDKGITPYNLRNCAYLPEFAKPKIVYSEIVREPQFYLDNGEFKFGYFYAEATSFILSGNKNFKSSLEYLLGLLHSKLCTFAFKEFYAGGGLGESGYRYKKAFLENLPIPKITQSQEAEFIAIMREIIECKKSLGAKGNKNTRSLRGAEIVEKGGSSASARLELEANKRGSPLDCQKSGIFFGAKGSVEGINPFLREEKDSNNKEELQDLESRLDSLETKLDSMVFSLYGLDEKEINIIVRGGGKYSLAYLLLACVESQLIVLVKLLCENFELELKETFKFCEGLKVPQKQYQGKIVWAEMTDTPCFVYDTQGFYINQTCYFIPRDDKYLCAILNSKLIYFYMQQIASNLGDGAFRWIKQYIEKLPIPQTTKANQIIVNQIIALVDEILNLKANCHSEPALAGEESLSKESRDSKRDVSGKSPQHDKIPDTSKLESEIDCLVYKLYSLSDKEIKIIKTS